VDRRLKFTDADVRDSNIPGPSPFVKGCPITDIRAFLIASRADRERVGSLSSDPTGLKWSEVPKGKLPVLMTVKPWLLCLTWNRQIGAEKPTELRLDERRQQRKLAMFRLPIPRVAKEGNDVAIVARDEGELVKLRKSIGRRTFWFWRKEPRKFQDCIWFVPESELKKVCPKLDAYLRERDGHRDNTDIKRFRGGHGTTLRTKRPRAWRNK
jgi:hypothetical protein